MVKLFERKDFLSFEHASILRKFTILFVLMSLIPVSLLFYFYLQIHDHESIQITTENLRTTLILVVVGVLIGYLAMRSVINQLIRLTETNLRAVESLLNPSKIKELSEEKNEIAVLTHAFRAITSRLEESVKSLETAKKTLHSVMARVGEGIANMRNIDSFLELILETVTDGLASKVGLLLLYSPKLKCMVVKTVYGIDSYSADGIRLKVENNATFQKILENHQSVIIEEETPAAREFRGLSHIFKFPMICTPLYINQKSLLGVLCIGGRVKGEKYSEDELSLLTNLASQTAVAIENARLSQDLEKTYFETISALALAVDAKDPYSRGHLDRVALYAVQIAVKLGLEEEDIRTLRDAARLHDIGKIGIPDEVLRKSGALVEQEWILMRKHPEIGEGIIRPIRSLQHLCDIIRHHHEKLDGTGYPDGLKGEEITPLVRIITVADIYDALTTNRPYRDKLSPEQARVELRRMNDKIDQEIVELFIEALKEQ